MNNLIASEPWRAQAACADHPQPWLWDAFLDDERHDAKIARQDIALSVCTHCPVRAECLADVDPQLDEGVRGGRVLDAIPRPSKLEARRLMEVGVSAAIAEILAAGRRRPREFAERAQVS